MRYSAPRKTNAPQCLAFRIPRSPFRVGFTLIELLVVVAIIVALLAILMPSMNRAIDAAHLAVCGSQQNQIGIALLGYAADEFGRLPEGNASAWPTMGVDATWRSGGAWASYAARGEGQPMGLAFLIMNGYAETPEAYYCPAWTHPYHQYDKVDTAGLDPNGGPNAYGGWPAADSAGPTTFRGISYMYRSSVGKDPTTPGFIQPGGRAPNLSRDGGIPIAADHYTERYVEWDDYTHPAGYMALYLDGSSQFKPDPDHKYMSDEQGANSHGEWGTQERIWLEFFGR